jgi:hypothetical protein
MEDTFGIMDIVLFQERQDIVEIIKFGMDGNVQIQPTVEQINSGMELFVQQLIILVRTDFIGMDWHVFQVLQTVPLEQLGMVILVLQTYQIVQLVQIGMGQHVH